jgi:hypothetical protein
LFFELASIKQNSSSIFSVEQKSTLNIAQLQALARSVSFIQQNPDLVSWLGLFFLAPSPENIHGVIRCPVSLCVVGI